MNKWAAIAAVAFFAFLAIMSYSDNVSQTEIVRACVSSGGEWVDGREGIGVTMECQR